MADLKPDSVSAPRTTLADKLDDAIEAFADLARLPRAFWFVLLAFVFESMSYFGVLTLMTVYLGTDLGWGDQYAGLAVSIFTMLVTLFMLGAGSYAESFGLRRAIIAALVICVIGRLMYNLGPTQAAAGAAFLIIAALLIIAIGEAILQPVCYSGVKQYTDEKTSSMGYGLIYAVMNAGIVVIGAISAEARPAVQAVLTERQATQPASGPAHASWAIWLADHVGSGVQAVNWICWGITVLTLVAFVVLMTSRAESAKIRPDTAEEQRKTESRPLGERLASYFTEGPFTNPRFIFFIFMLLPVRTLFAHQWLTMPNYILRSYSQEVGDKMEWLVNWINPGIIFFGVPIATALTRRVNVYTMMIIGSLVSAVPTFLLCSGPNLWLLITYFVLFSVGEALWSARFLEYASELAPPGRIAQYMGLANIPWLLAKGTTGLYSGYMLATFCPDKTPPEQLHTGTMWFIYGCIAMASPIGLLLARRWVMAGLHSKPARTGGV
jgi:POT family proton-dependent oligopeptide transporter